MKKLKKKTFKNFFSMVRTNQIKNIWSCKDICPVWWQLTFFKTLLWGILPSRNPGSPYQVDHSHPQDRRNLQRILIFLSTKAVLTLLPYLTLTQMCTNLIFCFHEYAQNRHWVSKSVVLWPLLELCQNWHHSCLPPTLKYQHNSWCETPHKR